MKQYMKSVFRGLLLVPALYCLVVPVLLNSTEMPDEGVVLAYQYREGDRYRILSTVKQNIYVDGRFSHSAEILNRIQINVKKTEDSAVGRRGFIEVDYESGEMVDFAPGVYHQRGRYHSEFWRDTRGRYEIEPGFFVPVVRDVPVWPEHALVPGQTWNHEGYEVHDFRNPFGIPEPYEFPVQVNYRYRGKTMFEGKELDLIEINYTVFYRSPRRTQEIYPSVVSGYSSQLLYFDNEKGRPAYYEEEYDLEIRMNNASVFRFAGEADARVIESGILDREQVIADIQSDLDSLQLTDARVGSDERGVTISLSDIQFPPDSARLLSSEQQKLGYIAEILKRYPDFDVLVSGHTALAGTEEGRQRLSEERAAAVGRYLIQLGVRDADQLIYQGYGADRPIADNSTEDGRRLNRRVELTIIDE